MEKVVILSALSTFIICALVTKALIPMLIKLKMGQKILEIGPAWHVAKQGTPTMGGLAFILATIPTVLVFALIYRWSVPLLLMTGYALLNGIIGLIDDLTKIKKKQNEGLSAFSKLLLQLFAAGVFLVLAAWLGQVSEEIYIPFWGRSIYIGRLWYVFALLFLVGFTNAVNLSDGLDGLCSSVSGGVALGLTIIAVTLGEYANTVFGFAILGCCLAFLIYNFHPAKVFMGDTGSLFLGAGLSAMSLLSYKNTALIIIGGVYLIEAISVILQVLYYKATKKRLFLMAPFHHHLEKRGYGEVKITLLMTAITLALALISYLFL